MMMISSNSSRPNSSINNINIIIHIIIIKVGRSWMNGSFWTALFGECQEPNHICERDVHLLPDLHTVSTAFWAPDYDKVYL